MLQGLQDAQAITEDYPLTGHFGNRYSWVQYAFKAPEIDSEFVHDKRVDLWALGAIVNMLLTALSPFRGEREGLVANKQAGNVVFDPIIPSRPSQELVKGLLQPDPDKRLTFEQVLGSEWMNETEEVLDLYDLTDVIDMMQDVVKQVDAARLRS